MDLNVPTAMVWEVLESKSWFENLAQPPSTVAGLGWSARFARKQGELFLVFFNEQSFSNFGGQQPHL